MTHEGRLLDGIELSKRLEIDLKSAETEVLLVSAYLKASVMEWLARLVPANISVNVLVRFRKADILAGSSDLKIFEISQKHGWKLFFDNEVHTKALIIDDKKLIIGSSNYTGNGLSLFQRGNKEMNIEVIPTAKELNKITQYFSLACPVTTKLHEMMLNEIDNKEALEQSASLEDWSALIMAQTTPIVDRLWVSECLNFGPEKHAGENKIASSKDQALWDGIPNLEKAKSLRLFKWIDNVLLVRKHDLRFGEVTSVLHEALINEPAPYRREVKLFVQVLFDWIEELQIYEVRRFKHTKSIVNPYV